MAVQADIDAADPGSELRRPRQHLFRRLESLGPEQLHAADPQHRQEGQREDDDADAAEPLQDRPPQQNAGRCIVQADDDGGPGRRNARHRFEERVGIGQFQFGEGERQGRKGGDDQPAQPGEGEGLAQVEPEALGAVRQDQRDADEQGDPGRLDERGPVFGHRGQVGRDGHEHDDGENRQQHAANEEDRSKIQHVEPAFERGRSRPGRRSRLRGADYTLPRAAGKAGPA